MTEYRAVGADGGVLGPVTAVTDAEALSRAADEHGAQVRVECRQWDRWVNVFPYHPPVVGTAAPDPPE